MFKDIPTKKKVEAVGKVVKGRPLSKVAREYKVNRNSLHHWVKKARESILKSLILEKRGPKLTVESFRKKQEEIRKLREKFNKQRIKLEKLKFDVSESKNNLKKPRPTKCPYCGCEKIYRNGYFQISSQRLISLIEKNSEQKFSRQQFICGYCNRRVGFKLESSILLNK